MRVITDMYSLRDIYNMDETAFFYHAESPRTLSRQGKVSGHKADKTRSTMAVATNADGSDKLPLLFIGKSMKPRAFKGHDVTAELCVEYTNSKKAWMNGMIFLRWLHALDHRMKRANRHILLLVDNVSSHMKPLNPLTNVRLEFLPKNTTSVMQPLDQGIIANIKRIFSRIKMEDCINRYIAGQPQQKISIFTAISWASKAWNDVTPDAIRNCWVHSGIVPRPTSTVSVRSILY